MTDSTFFTLSASRNVKKTVFVFLKSQEEKTCSPVICLGNILRGESETSLSASLLVYTYTFFALNNSSECTTEGEKGIYNPLSLSLSESS